MVPGGEFALTLSNRMSDIALILTYSWHSYDLAHVLDHASTPERV